MVNLVFFFVYLMSQIVTGALRFLIHSTLQFIFAKDHCCVMPEIGMGGLRSLIYPILICVRQDLSFDHLLPLARHLSSLFALWQPFFWPLRLPVSALRAAKGLTSLTSFPLKVCSKAVTR